MDNYNGSYVVYHYKVVDEMCTKIGGEATRENVEVLLKNLVVGAEGVFGNNTKKSPAPHRVVIAGGVTFNHNGKKSGDIKNIPEIMRHNPSFKGIFAYVNAPDLTCGKEAAELKENGKISDAKYLECLEERLTSALLAIVNATDKQLIVTLPGLGAGNFAGKYDKKKVTKSIHQSLVNILNKYSDKLKKIKAVVFDTYEASILPDSYVETKYLDGMALEIQYFGRMVHEISGIKLFTYASQGREECPGLTDSPTNFSRFLRENYEECEIAAIVAGNKGCIPGTHNIYGNTDEDRKESVAGREKVIGSKKKLQNLPVLVCNEDGNLSDMVDYIMANRGKGRMGSNTKMPLQSMILLLGIVGLCTSVAVYNSLDACDVQNG